jgi:type I restriction enzyme, R subunit
MNKKELTEADIRTTFITPAIVGADGSKWDVMTQVREETYFTKGRVIVRGKTVRRGEAQNADYILYYRPNIPVAVIEAIRGAPGRTYQPDRLNDTANRLGSPPSTLPPA